MERKKILLVDDSTTALMMEKMLLSRGPYDLETAGDGEQAVAQATANPPDLILLDIKMPKKDGLETLQELRAHEATRDVPVIMVTTRSERANVDQAFEIGCNAYVYKPINAEELFSTVRELLSAEGSS